MITQKNVGQTRKTKLMAHMVAGYPNIETSFTIGNALAKGGAEYLEVQFPFSDPSSDGPVIERACQTALDNNFKVSDGFALVSRLHEEFSIPVFIMTYGSLVFARGADQFCQSAVQAGARGVIVPDFPPDYSEGLFDAGQAHGIAVVPVIAPEISNERLAMIERLCPEYVYTALRLGITGTQTILDTKTIHYLNRLKNFGTKIIAGFGIRSSEQMHLLSGFAHAAAVGSYFLEIINTGGDIETKLRDAVYRIKADR